MLGNYLNFRGIYNSYGRGRKKLFTVEQEQQIKNWVKETPKNLGKVQEKILREWGNTVSKKTIKRIIKSAYMGWYRIKRRVGGKPVPEFYDKKVKKLDKLKEQESTGEIEIRYVDGAYRLLN